jgi:hypothetical protein
MYIRAQKGVRFLVLWKKKSRIICQSTPKFSQQVSNKYGQMGSYQVAQDLKDNHGRNISRNRIQEIAQRVGTIIGENEEEWRYEIKVAEQDVKVISLGLDGTMANIVDDGWREMMSGTISLYNAKLERLHTIYIGQSPQYGKGDFKKRMQREIDRVKVQYSNAYYIGLADGATDNWSFLESQTSCNILDFWRATEYLGKISKMVSPSKYEQKQWLTQTRHRLRHDKEVVPMILKELKEMRKKKLSKLNRKSLEQTITYFTNHGHKMNYAQYAEHKLPIGSGVTEAACKVLVKQRFCNSGMRWKIDGAQKVLNIRSMILTKGRWKQLWENIDTLGCAA